MVSDDERTGVRTRNQRKKAGDDEFTCFEDDEDADSQIAMDQLEVEVLSEDEEDKALHKKAKKERTVTRRHRSDVEEAKLEDDEQCETVFLDNLPNEEDQILTMLKDCRIEIKKLEEQFFEENDSELEEEAEKDLMKQEKGTGIKQFWCVPLSVNVLEFEFDKLIKSQLKHAGRLFDVITMDPPWQLSSANPTRGVAIAYDTLKDEEILDRIPF